MRLILLLAAAAMLAPPHSIGKTEGPENPRQPVIHEVRMLGDDEGFRFEPAHVTVNAGDSIRFIMVSGEPHNVAFDPAEIPAAAEATLSENLPDRMSPLAGPLLTESGSSYTMGTAGLEPGAYPYFCMPHMAMGMTGTITVAEE